MSLLITGHDDHVQACFDGTVLHFGKIQCLATAEQDLSDVISGSLHTVRVDRVDSIVMSNLGYTCFRQRTLLDFKQARMRHHRLRALPVFESISWPYKLL